MEETNKWERLSGSADEVERIYRKSRTFLGDVWYRFRRKTCSYCFIQCGSREEGQDYHC